MLIIKYNNLKKFSAKDAPFFIISIGQKIPKTQAHLSSTYAWSHISHLNGLCVVFFVRTGHVTNGTLYFINYKITIH